MLRRRRASTIVVSTSLQAYDSTNLHYLSAGFDNTQSGEYSIALYQYDANGNAIDHLAVNVNVTLEPASLMLLGTGLFSVGAFPRASRSAS